nr:hypothetical protein [Myxococcales bacterium]
GWLRTVGRGPTRQLALLDVVREYASQHLTSADEQEAQARHTAFYLQRTAHLVSSSALAEILLDGIDDTGVADVDHVEAIVRRPGISARERTDAALAGFVLLLRQGPAPRVHQLLAEAQGALPDDAELSAARLALAAHHAKRFFGTPLKSFLTLADALKAARAAPDEPLAAQLLHYQGRELRLAGHAREGAELYDQALALARSSGDQPTIALCLQGPAITAIRVQPAPEAQDVAGQMVRTATELGYRRMRCVWLDNYGVQLFEAGQIREAWTRGSEAVALERATDNVALMAVTLVNMSEYAAADDRFDDARRCLDEAAELFAVTAAESLPMASWGRANALLALAEGRLDDAERSAPPGQQIQPDLAVGLDHQVRAMLCLLRGQAAEAVAELHTTEQLGAGVSRETFTDRALWLGFRALGEALLAQPEQARATLDAAKTEADRWDYARLKATLGVLEAAVDLACGAPGAQARAEQVLEHAHARTHPFLPYLETRIACRMLSQCLGAAGPTLTLGPDLAWVRTDDGARLVLHRSPLPRRLLTALLTAHREERGRAVSTPTLLTAGWPGDRARQEALENRLWVALSKLRRSGLQHVLERVDGGYRIAPGVRIVDHTDP